MKRYLCVHCDHRFESEGEGRPRCPKCMRVHGIERISGDGTEPEAARRRMLFIGGLVLLLASAGIGYALWTRTTPDAVTGDAPARPLSLPEIRGHLKKLGADPETYVSFFEAGDHVEDLAERAVRGSSPVDKAKAVTDYIRQRSTKSAFVPWSITYPRTSPIRGVEKTAEAMLRDGGRAKLYPLEVAALAVSALREEGVDAMVAEVVSFPDERTPPDPSGHFGYYAVAVYPGDVGKGKPKIFDAYAGRSTDRMAPENYRVLTDVQVMGAVLNHAAIHNLVNEQNPSHAFSLSQSALRLDRRSPSIRMARGAVLINSGGIEEGVQEFEAAMQIRPDAARHNNIAGLHLARGDMARASQEVAKVLETHPDYASAHANLAAVYLANRELPQAENELATTQRLDPDLPNLPMLWANYYLSAHDIDRAVVKAREAVQRRPHDWQSRIQAGQIYRAASLYDEMRTSAQQAVELAPPARRAEVRSLIERLLGPTALEEAAEGGGDTEEDPSAALGQGGVDLRLGSKGARLLDSEGGGGALKLDDSLGGGAAEGADPSLRLHGSDQGFKLRLQE